MPDPSPKAVAMGHAFYTKRTLAVYDALILGFFSRVAWRCPSARILAHYDAHVTNNHLDVGPGTGYFLDRCSFTDAAPRIALLDANQACLDATTRRIARYRPDAYLGDVFQPVGPFDAGFDSIGLNYLLHCLPGTIESKAVVFSNLLSVANPGATVFGATLLHDGVNRNWVARQVMSRNNRVGIFSNRADSLGGLTSVLHEHLEEVTVEPVGCVAVFAGNTPGMAT